MNNDTEAKGVKDEGGGRHENNKGRTVRGEEDGKNSQCGELPGCPRTS